MRDILIVQNRIPHYRKPLYNELSEYYDVTVLHSGKTSVGADDRYKEIITSVKTLSAVRLQSGVLKELRDSDYYAVIVMFDIRWVANVMAVFLRRKARFLYWGHRYSNSRLGNRIRDVLMLWADGVILYSDCEVQRMISNGIAESKIFVAPNTIHIPNHSDGSGSHKESLLFVGRAQRRKHVEDLIRAFSAVQSRIPSDVRIDIVGSGSENDRLQSIASQLRISDRVVFHGEIVNHEQLKLLFDRAFAYVSPGAVGLGVLHSFAYGVPVVTRISEPHGPEYGNMLEGVNCLCFRTEAELEEIIVKLCNDRELASRLGHCAYELYAQERTLEKLVKGLRDAIEGSGQEL